MGRTKILLEETLDRISQRKREHPDITGTWIKEYDTETKEITYI